MIHTLADWIAKLVQILYCIKIDNIIAASLIDQADCNSVHSSGPFVHSSGPFVHSSGPFVHSSGPFVHSSGPFGGPFPSCLGVFFRIPPPPPPPATASIHACAMQKLYKNKLCCYGRSHSNGCVRLPIHMHMCLEIRCRFCLHACSLYTSYSLGFILYARGPSSA